MKWLITGASGQLGKSIFELFSVKGLEFLALDSKQLDIRNTNDVEKLIANYKPNFLINAAAWTDVEGAELNSKSTYEVNEFGVENLVKSAKNHNSVFIHISTDYVFSGFEREPWLEGSPTNAQGVYGKSKAAGESVVKRILPNRSYIVRTAWLYSSFGSNFAKTMCRLAMTTDRDVGVVNDQVGQPTHARDLAAQIYSLVNSASTFGIYHGTNSGQATRFEFAQEIFRLSGANSKRVIPINSDSYPSSVIRPKYSVLSHKSWLNGGVAPMQNWRDALEIAMPSILGAVLKEGYQNETDPIRD